MNALRSWWFSRLSQRGIERRLLLPCSNGTICDLLRWGGAEVGRDVRFRQPITFINFRGGGKEWFRGLSIGDNVFIGHNVQFDLKDDITISSHSTISANAVLLTHTDVGRIPRAATMPPTTAPLAIETNVYLGANCVVLAGTTIATGAVVAAGAVVTKDVPANTIVAGVPARVVKELGEAS